MDTVMTVLGEVNVQDLGRVLPHEHIASVYGRWGKQIDHRVPAWEGTVLDHYAPMFRVLVDQYECRALVECSPSFGFRQVRDLEVWAELSRRSGLHIIISTGFYTASVRPRDFGERSVKELADVMIKEAVEGITGTGVRAGIIKVGIGDFGDDDRKLLKAAALAQRETGLSITTHTCSPEIRSATLNLLEGAGVAPDRVTLGHADTNATPIELLSLAKRGCNLLLTIWGIRNTRLIGWGLPVLPVYHSPSLVALLAAEGYGSQVMASIDYSAGFGDGRFERDLYDVEGRTHLYMFTHGIGMLERMGVSSADIESMLRDNPARMLLARL